MKKLLFALAVLLPLFVQAQQEKSRFSLICHGGTGVNFNSSINHIKPLSGGYIGTGIDGKFDLNSNWSLLAGLEYQYDFRLNPYLFNDAFDNTEMDIFLHQSHHYRLPIMAEYHVKWFYVAAGAFYGISCIYDTLHFACGGVCFDIGGRIKLSENGFLRIGLRPNIVMVYRFELPNTPIWCNGTAIVGVGYEYHF